MKIQVIEGGGVRIEAVATLKNSYKKHTATDEKVSKIWPALLHLLLILPIVADPAFCYNNTLKAAPFNDSCSLSDRQVEILSNFSAHIANFQQFSDEARLFWNGPDCCATLCLRKNQTLVGCEGLETQLWAADQYLSAGMVFSLPLQNYIPAVNLHSISCASYEVRNASRFRGSYLTKLQFLQYFGQPDSSYNDCPKYWAFLPTYFQTLQCLAWDCTGLPKFRTFKEIKGLEGCKGIRPVSGMIDQYLVRFPLYCSPNSTIERYRGRSRYNIQQP